MKNNIYILLTLAVGMTVSSCVEKIGTEPGNDPIPVVTVYNYTPSAEYDGDTDQRVRFVNNGVAKEAFYLVDKSSNKAAIIEEQGEDAYIQKVISEGTAITFDDSGVYETVLTNMTGDYDITAVASNGTTKTMRSATFSGIAWDASSSINGTYMVQRANIQGVVGAASFPAVLQRHEADETLYRIKGALGAGTKITIKLLDITGTDDDGEYTFFRIPAQATPYSYGDYGTISVRDIGYWQGDDAWVTENGYESGMYADGYCFLCIQYYVAAGSLGMTYDYFVPSGE